MSIVPETTRERELQAEADAAELRRVMAGEPEPRYCECGAELDPSLPRQLWCEACVAKLSAVADDGLDTHDPADQLCREIASPAPRSPDEPLEAGDRQPYPQQPKTT